MNRNSINVGKKIKTYRKAKKYTLKNLAKKPVCQSGSSRSWKGA